MWFLDRRPYPSGSKLRLSITEPGRVLAGFTGGYGHERGNGCFLDFRFVYFAFCCPTHVCDGHSLHGELVAGTHPSTGKARKNCVISMVTKITAVEGSDAS